MERRLFGRSNGKFLVQEPDGAITSHDKNPLAPESADATPAADATPDATNAPQGTATDYESMTAQQLRAIAKERGVVVPQGAKKADLVALLTTPAADATPDDPEAEDQGEDDGGEE